jgi:RHS repeat-associated protein
VSDGTFTYAYNAAGRMARAEGVTLTLVYTYNASGLRVAQSVDGEVTTFAWDWATGVPEMLSEGQAMGSSIALYLVGHETLGRWDGADWTYYLPDALGSIRQETDGTGAVTDSREWTPFGVEVGAAQEGLGFTGEWWDPKVGLVYLRARWYDSGVGRFTRHDPWKGNYRQPLTMNPYLYALASPANYTDPTGRTVGFSCDWPTTRIISVLDGRIRRVDNELCQELDDPGASLRLIEDFYRHVVIPGQIAIGAWDAAILLERSLDEKTTPYQVTARLGQQLRAVPSHQRQLKEHEQIFLGEVKDAALSMGCTGFATVDYDSGKLLIQAYNKGETTNVKIAMADHIAWFTWKATVQRDPRHYRWWVVRGTLDRDIADYSDWHGDPHDYDNDGTLECPGGQCYKKASMPIPDQLLASGETRNRIVIPDDWMARLVVGGEASYPGFGIYYNTREQFAFGVGDWSRIPEIKYRMVGQGDQYRETTHELDPGYFPP